MYSRIRSPQNVAPALLDDYLEAGWRCIGQEIYTSHFMRFPPEEEGQLYSTVPTRLPLSEYGSSKSMRRLWKRGSQKFKIEAGSCFHFDEAAQRVHEAYTRAFPDRPLTGLEFYLNAPQGPFTFDTRSVKVFDGERLIAFSVFNLGEKSIYSSQGVYDPAYRAHSLGLLTMLAEIEYGLATGRQYFYPGYVVPGYPEFDYKHRVGPLEYYLLPSGTWQPAETVAPQDIPVNQMKTALAQLKSLLQGNGIGAIVCDYLHFDIRFFDDRPLPYLEFPFVLIPEVPEPSKIVPMAVFHPERQNFQVLNAKFFGLGVHHTPAYQQLMKQKPGLLRLPVAVLSTLGQDLCQNSALEIIQGFAQPRSPLPLFNSSNP
ncbi:GNAT family N-acetyltransferase [Phaeodactylibacter luteus]|uniref:GNAT family N-acetyltransferase n=1 Tax=Phaeodactylibacter luteus TaxID=1564516 RepID=A0A5C6RI89_9BACT|nr:GNAT family N-acetyltransferase [Phaeodactylibacter luteus]